MLFSKINILLNDPYHPLGENLISDKNLINEIYKKHKIDFMVCNASVSCLIIQDMNLEKENIH